MLTFGRDPFARTERTRQTVFQEGASCAWCGAKPDTHTGRRYLYRYGTETDAGRRYMDDRLFCCVSCRDSYY